MGQGQSGMKGDTGPQGIQGLPGPQGPPGEKGDTGMKGDTGPQGIQGLQGPQGPPGVVDWATFSDAQKQDLINKLKAYKEFVGLQGPQGVKGDTGVAGPQGQTGPQGPPGVKGDTGVAGPQGPIGVKGDTGPQGPPGPQGIKGDTGSQGPAGVWPQSVDKLCIGPQNNNWCFIPNQNGQYLDLVRNGAGDNPDSAVYHFTQDGNLWLNRSSQRGWIADNVANLANNAIRKDKTYGIKSSRGGYLSDQGGWKGRPSKSTDWETMTFDQIN